MKKFTLFAVAASCLLVSLALANLVFADATLEQEVRKCRHAQAQIDSFADFTYGFHLLRSRTPEGDGPCNRDLVYGNKPDLNCDKDMQICNADNECVIQSELAKCAEAPVHLQRYMDVLSRAQLNTFEVVNQIPRFDCHV